MLCISMILSSFVPELQAAAPDAGTIQRDVERKTPSVSRPESPTVIKLPGKAAVSGNVGALRFTVRRFVIEGATLISEASLQAELSGLIGKSLTLDELNAGVVRIMSAYNRAGYIAEAYVPAQEVHDGVVTIRVVEARLGRVFVESKPGSRLRPDLARGYVTSSQHPGEYIDTRKLERGLRLLQSTPGVSSSAVIRPGTMPSTVDAVLSLDKVPFVRWSVGVDNFGDVSTGERRVNAGVNLESPSSNGDRLSLKALHSGGLNYGRFLYTLPLGTNGLSAGVSASWLGYKLGGDFKALDATGQSVTAGAFVGKTLVAGQHSSLSGSIGYDYKNFTDDVAQSRTGDKHLQTVSIGLSGGWRDDFMGGGWTAGSALITKGVLDLSKVAVVKTLDSQTAGTDGGYNKANLSFSREQQLVPDRLSLTASVTGQIASRNLDSSEKFILGGPSGVRAYPMSEGAGDNGMLFTAELRHQATNAIQLFGFYDRGFVRQHLHLWQGWQTLDGEPNTYSLQGIGAGLLLRPFHNLIVRGTVAKRLGSNPLADAQGHDHDGTKRNPRFWLEAAFIF